MTVCAGVFQDTSRYFKVIGPSQRQEDLRFICLFIASRSMVTSLLGAKSLDIRKRIFYPQVEVYAMCRLDDIPFAAQANPRSGIRGDSLEVLTGTWVLLDWSSIIDRQDDRAALHHFHTSL